VESGVVGAEKLTPLRPRVRRTDRHFCYHPEACETFIIHNSSFYFSWFVSDRVTSLQELCATA
jgi:hypothetical protein